MTIGYRRSGTRTNVDNFWWLNVCGLIVSWKYKEKVFCAEYQELKELSIFTFMSANTSEIKRDLIKRITEIDDESILCKVQAYFSTLKHSQVDWWDMISDQEKKAIDIGLEQLKNGEGISHDSVKQKVRDLLSGK
jgi:hypothetical protein